MKPAIVALALASAASAVPASAAEPTRILPYNWQFELTDFFGPGCPDKGKKPEGRQTRLTFGENTVDGSEKYNWFEAYPFMHGMVDANKNSSHTWCISTLSYVEHNDQKDATKATEDYRLRLHKDGTEVIAHYDLDEGVQAEWYFFYIKEDYSEITDTVTVNGPRHDGLYDSPQINSEVGKPDPYPLPKCGSGSFQVRVELFVDGKDGAKGTVASENVTLADGTVDYYGAQLGFSYDFEKCTK